MPISTVLLLALVRFPIAGGHSDCSLLVELSLTEQSAIFCRSCMTFAELLASARTSSDGVV